MPYGFSNLAYLQASSISWINKKVGLDDSPSKSWRPLAFLRWVLSSMQKIPVPRVVDVGEVETELVSPEACGLMERPGPGF